MVLPTSRYSTYPHQHYTVTAIFGITVGYRQSRMKLLRRYDRHASSQNAASARLVSDLCGERQASPALWQFGHQSTGSMKSPH